MQQSLYHAAVTVMMPALLKLRITNRICSSQSNIYVGNQWKSMTEYFWPFWPQEQEPNSACACRAERALMHAGFARNNVVQSVTHLQPSNAVWADKLWQQDRHIDKVHV